MIVNNLEIEEAEILLILEIKQTSEKLSYLSYRKNLLISKKKIRITYDKLQNFYIIEI